MILPNCGHYVEPIEAALFWFTLIATHLLQRYNVINCELFTVIAAIVFLQTDCDGYDDLF